MHLFKLFVSHHATERELETTISHGPFVVAAESDWWARILVTLNCVIAVRSQPGETPATNIWSKFGASECLRLEHIDTEASRQRRIVEGVDLAKSFLDYPSWTADGKEVARMIWWPCRPGDRCPV
jgi:hypothetical protein